MGVGIYSINICFAAKIRKVATMKPMTEEAIREICNEKFAEIYNSITEDTMAGVDSEDYKCELEVDECIFIRALIEKIKEHETRKPVSFSDVVNKHIVDYKGDLNGRGERQIQVNKILEAVKNL